MRRTVLPLLGVVGLFAASAVAGPNVGDKAPGISAGSWMNLPGGLKAITPAELKGQVILLDFWATW